MQGKERERERRGRRIDRDGQVKRERGRERKLFALSAESCQVSPQEEDEEEEGGGGRFEGSQAGQA